MEDVQAHNQSEGDPAHDRHSRSDAAASSPNPRSPARSTRSKTNRSRSNMSKTGAGAAPSKSTSSRTSRTSAALTAKRAALLVEAAAMAEREQLEQRMLKLKQQASRLELKTEIDKLEAEQAVLEEEENSLDSASDDNEVQINRDRVAAWVATTMPPVASPPAATPTVASPTAATPAVAPPQNNNSQVSSPEVDQQLQGNDGKVNSLGMEGLVQALQIPKAELITFDGDPIKYWTFTRAFNNSIGKHAIDDDAKLARLLQYCTGRAYKVIESCAALPTSQGYQRALKLLQERFGDTYLIPSSWVNRISISQRVTTDGLRDFADELSNMNQTLIALLALSEINQQTLLRIVERLPTYLQHRWRRRAALLTEHATTPSLGDLVDFASLAAREVADPVYGNLGAAKKPDQPPKRSSRGFHGATAVADGQSQRVQCPACHSNDCPYSAQVCSVQGNETPEAV